MRKARDAYTLVLGGVAATISAAWVVSCSKPETAPPPRRLNNATLAQWRDASAADQLATSELIVTNLLLARGVDPRAFNHDEAREWGGKLAECVTEKAASDDGQTIVAEAAERCMDELKLGPKSD